MFVAGHGFAVVGALPVPDLPAGVARIGENSRDGPHGPGCAGSVAVAAGIVGGGGGDAAVVEGAGDAGGAGTGEALREDPPHVRCGVGVGVGVEAVQPPSPAGVVAVGVGSGVDQAVAVGWAVAEVASLVAGLAAHGVGGAHAGAVGAACLDRLLGALVEVGADHSRMGLGLRPGPFARVVPAVPVLVDRRRVHLAGSPQTRPVSKSRRGSESADGSRRARAYHHNQAA